MHGNGGDDLAVSPIVVQPGDRQGPTVDMPNRAFFMYAPQFSWNVLNIQGTVDEPARRAVERIAQEAFTFGRQTEECEGRLVRGLIDAEQKIEALEKEVAALLSLDRVRHRRRFG